VILAKYCWNDQVKEKGMGRAYSMHVGSSYIQGFGRKSPRKETLEDLHVDGRIILK
jgi:hypothetical protein